MDDRVKPRDTESETEWESAWLAEVERREALEPERSLGREQELPAVRERLLRLFA